MNIYYKFAKKNSAMKYFISTIILLISLQLFSQQKHTVIAKETMYSLTKKYNVSEQQIIKSNPFLKERGMQPGDVLAIPSKAIIENSSSISSTTKVLKDENGFLELEIGAKETIYNLTKKYKISEAVLKENNPFLNERMLNPGDIIKIPSKSSKITTKLNEKTKELAKETEKIVKPEPTKTTIVSQDDEYLTLKAGATETISNLAKVYEITERKIKRENSFLKERDIQEGDFVKIPMSKKISKKLEEEKNTVIETKIISETKDFIFIEVGNRETLDNLAKIYNVSTERIKKANPILNSNKLSSGLTLKIPNFKNTTERYKDDTINIVYFLPFDIKNKQKSGPKIASTNFLAGSRFALDSIYHKGKKINVSVFDSSDENKFDSILLNYNFKKTDLVIGPLKQSQLEKSSSKLNIYNIPIVSPASNNETLARLPNFILASTSEEKQMEYLIEEIKLINNNQVIYLLGSPKQTDVLKNIETKLKELNFSDVKIISNPSEIIIPQNVMTEKYQNIIPVLVSEDVAVANEFITKINELDANYVTPISFHYFKTFDDQTTITKLSKTGFSYIYVEKANLKDINTIKTLQLFKKSYCEIPDKYAILGFDITYDLVSRMNESGEIIDFQKIQNQISNQFHYIKKSNNTFENEGVRVGRISKQKVNSILQ